MKQQTRYTRKGAVITDLESQEVQTHKSINQAKKASRALQGSTLGQGLVKVLPHKTKAVSVTLDKSYRTPVKTEKVKAATKTAVEQAATPKHKAKVTTKKASV